MLTKTKIKNIIAAIDLGSNSFHMVVAEENQGELIILDRIREMVRMAEGLDPSGKLDEEVEQRALDCLGRFGQRIRDLEPHCVSTVGTNTLRRIHNADDFLFQAEQALGFPIEIISGFEEARLVYQGVAHTLEQNKHSQLIIDIGGGSTELVIGEGFEPKLLNSLEMGCVMLTQRFFADEKIKTKRIQAARVFVLQKMKAVNYAYRGLGWESVIGSSGSVKSIANVIKEMELQDKDGIERQSLSKLLTICSDYKKLKKLDFPGLSEKRKPVFLGGLIILAGVFEALGIEHMHVSNGALREGLLYDMVGRRQNNDIRNKSVASLAKRFHTDAQHLSRIEQTAFYLYDQLKDNDWKDNDWKDNDWKDKNKEDNSLLDSEHASNLLRWACSLHEIGRNISHSGYQKHGGYIVDNADLAGFSRQEQHRLSSIVRAHRGKFIKESIKEKNDDLCQLIILLTVILRLSVIFHRSRTDNTLPAIGISVEDKKITLKLPENWLNEHPLTINDLEQEADYLSVIDLVLTTEKML